MRTNFLDFYSDFQKGMVYLYNNSFSNSSPPEKPLCCPDFPHWCQSKQFEDSTSREIFSSQDDAVFAVIKQVSRGTLKFTPKIIFFKDRN